MTGMNLLLYGSGHSCSRDSENLATSAALPPRVAFSFSSKEMFSMSILCLLALTKFPSFVKAPGSTEIKEAKPIESLHYSSTIIKLGATDLNQTTGRTSLSTCTLHHCMQAHWGGILESIIS